LSGRKYRNHREEKERKATGVEGVRALSGSARPLLARSLRSTLLYLILALLVDLASLSYNSSSSQISLDFISPIPLL
jgi:hypothetical protein